MPKYYYYPSNPRIKMGEIYIYVPCLCDKELSEKVSHRPSFVIPVGGTYSYSRYNGHERCEVKSIDGELLGEASTAGLVENTPASYEFYFTKDWDYHIRKILDHKK